MREQAGDVTEASRTAAGFFGGNRAGGNPRLRRVKKAGCDRAIPTWRGATAWRRTDEPTEELEGERLTGRAELQAPRRFPLSEGSGGPDDSAVPAGFKQAIATPVSNRAPLCNSPSHPTSSNSF